MSISIPVRRGKRHRDVSLALTVTLAIIIVAIALIIPITVISAHNNETHQPILSVDASNDGQIGLVSSDSPILNYGSLYADAEGRTHVQICQLKGFEFKSYAPPAGAQWLGIPPGEIKSIAYAVLPVGYVGDWHHAPGPQWVVTLSGHWSVEATDGTVLKQGPGEIQFDADMAAKPQRTDGHIGHLTRTVGDTPNVQLIVSLKASPAGKVSVAPCQPSER